MNAQSARSLHYRDPSGQPNEYMKAIMAVGEILASYDQTSRFPVWSCTPYSFRRGVKTDQAEAFV